jgi:hypothetical protein
MQAYQGATLTRAKAVAALGAAIVAAGGLAAVEASGSAKPAAASTIQVTAKPKGGNMLDLGRKGVSPGDEFFEHGVLTGGGNGTYSLSGQLVSGNARHGQEHAMLTLYLSGGTIEAVGGHGLGSHFTMPVVGGTGAYAAAHGTLGVAPGSGESETITVTLGS